MTSTRTGRLSAPGRQLQPSSSRWSPPRRETVRPRSAQGGGDGESPGTGCDGLLRFEIFRWCASCSTHVARVGALFLDAVAPHLSVPGAVVFRVTSLGACCSKTEKQQRRQSRGSRHNVRNRATNTYIYIYIYIYIYVCIYSCTYTYTYTDTYAYTYTYKHTYTYAYMHTYTYTYTYTYAYTYTETYTYHVQMHIHVHIHIHLHIHTYIYIYICI